MAEKARKSTRPPAAPRPSGYGRLPKATTVQFPERTLGIVKILAERLHRSQGEIIRQAVDGAGLAGVEGFEAAAKAYDRGTRAARSTRGTA